MNVPKIAVTVENDDNNTQKSLPIEETHTDVEDLDVTVPNKFKPKSRLKIKISNDGYVTDMEDLEISEVEEFQIPSTPLPDGLFDLDGGSVEEVQHTDIKTGKMIYKKGTIQRALAANFAEDGPTDLEDYCTESEPEEKDFSVVDTEPYEFESSVKEFVSEKIVEDSQESVTKKSKSRRRKKRNKQNAMLSPSDDGSDAVLSIPLENTESITDIEDIEVSVKSKASQLIFEDELKEQGNTDTESLESDTELKEETAFDETIVDSLNFEKNLNACTKKFQGDQSDWTETIKIGEREKLDLLKCKDLPTDEEILSDFDSYETQNRSLTPHLQFSEESIVLSRESTRGSDYLQKISYISDTEEVVIAGDVKSLLQSPNLEDDCHTEIEELDTDSSAKRPIKFKKRSSVTDVENIEMSDNDLDEEEGSSRKFQPRTNREMAKFRKKQLIEKSHLDLAATDVENFEISDEELPTLSRTETATPSEVHRDLDSMCSSRVHSEHKKKIDLSTPEEQLHIKGGEFEEARTDLEDVSVSEEDSKTSRCKGLSVDLAEDKITVTVQQMNNDVSLKWKNYTVKFGIMGGEGKNLGACFSLVGFLVLNEIH